MAVCCREHAPSIIFMDEVDSIGSARMESGSGGGGDSEVQRTMLELLNQLDGFEATNKIKAGHRPVSPRSPAPARPARQSRLQHPADALWADGCRYSWPPTG